ncbi:MAG: hypothetical protein QOG43_3281 [Actinomycetota bacterium]|jgi:hypothetical protein|nr:hypothetical protein [Actinomycetota bacterium]
MARGRRPEPKTSLFVLAIMIGLAATLATTSPSGAAAPISLGAAASFGVLAGTGVTNTGLTVINGDLGSCPTVAITGFDPPGVVHGTIHAGGPVACQAKSDLDAAYDATVLLAPTTSYLGPTDLGGLTLTAGVYNSPTSFGIGDTLTLDAAGDPNALFTFQAGTTLISSANTTVLLVNGAQACNVSWQVGSSATLGLGSTFKGSVLAYTSITVGAGIDVEGRLLARGGAVTLDSDAVTTPECAPPGSLTLTQTPTSGTALVEGTAVALPVTTVTDTRSATPRNWTVTATATNLVTPQGAVIPLADITLGQTGEFTTGTGTVGPLGLVSAAAVSLGSVYTYTPTATLATQGNITAGSYAGTVTQTVV